MFKDRFPYFNNTKNVYLDNAATTQKLDSSIEVMNEYYFKYCSNTHRSSFGDANEATKNYEDARSIIKEYINAKENKEIIFTKGVSESINFIANSYGKKFDTIIISSLEHHSNIVPWHMQGKTLHNGLEVVGHDSNLEFDFKHLEELLKSHKNALVSVTHISNAFGVIHDIKKVTQLAHKYNTPVLIDGAQSFAHKQIDIQDIACDFFAFSSHKTFGPTGVGGVYVKEKYLNELKAYQTGGATISDVSYERSILLDSPYKFEAGTQNIAGVIGFGETLRWLKDLDFELIEEHEKEIYKYLHEELLKIPNIQLYNDINSAIGSKSFNINGIHHDDIGTLLDKQHIAIRVGHHCAQPIMKELNIKGTIRVSIAFYNTKDDIDIFIKALNKAISILGK